MLDECNPAGQMATMVDEDAGDTCETEYAVGLSRGVGEQEAALDQLERADRSCGSGIDLGQ